MGSEERDVGYVPPFMQIKCEIMVDDPEAMLFSALQQIAAHMQFGQLPNAAKARCAHHLGEMLASRPDPQPQFNPWSA